MAKIMDQGRFWQRLSLPPTHPDYPVGQATKGEVKSMGYIAEIVSTVFGDVACHLCRGCRCQTGKRNDWTNIPPLTIGRLPLDGILWCQEETAPTAQPIRIVNRSHRDRGV